MQTQTVRRVKGERVELGSVKNNIKWMATEKTPVTDFKYTQKQTKKYKGRWVNSTVNQK